MLHSSLRTSNFASSRRAETLIGKVQKRVNAQEFASYSQGFAPATLQLLKKPSSARSELDILAIEKDVRKQAWIEKLPAEARNDKDAFKDVMRILSLRTFSEGTELAQAGDDMETFFVVVSGGLKALNPPEEEDEEERVAQLFRPGDVAGEEFLNLMISWETSLVVESEHAVLLQIEKELYSEAMASHFAGLINERTAFLKCVPPFSSWGDEEIRNMARLLKLEHYPSNYPIIQQGGIPKKFFIIFKGYCRVVKEIAVPARSLTILRAPMMPKSESLSSADPQPVSVKRRPVAADLQGGKCRNFGKTSWRCPAFRESLPRNYRWERSNACAIHDLPFKVGASTARTWNEESRMIRNTATRLTSNKKKLPSPEPSINEKRISASRRMRSKLVHDFHGDELEGSKKVMAQFRELWRGQYFGEQGIISKSVHAVSVISSSAVSVLALTKLDFCRLQQDIGEGAKDLIQHADQLGHNNDTEDMSSVIQMMEDEFVWTNFRQDMSVDSIFGSRFANTAIENGSVLAIGDNF